MARSCTKDPLEKFRFGVTWSTEKIPQLAVGNYQPADIESPKPSAGFHDVQMPKRSTNKISYREGIDPDISSVSAGLSTMEDIVLSRGLMSQSTYQEIGVWVKAVHSAGTSTDVSLAHDNSEAVKSKGTGSLDYRKDVWIWMYDRSGSIARLWKVQNAFPVNFVPGSDLSASEDGEKSMESLTLAYEDFIEIKAVGGVFPSSDDPAVYAAPTV